MQWPTILQVISLGRRSTLVSVMVLAWADADPGQRLGARPHGRPVPSAMARAKKTAAKRAAAREAAAHAGRPAGRHQPAGPARLRDPRDLRVRHRAPRQRGEVPAGGQGPALRRLRTGRRTASSGCSVSTSRPGSSPPASGAHDPDRKRKLLVHRRQIDELMGRTQQQSLTLVPYCRSTSGRPGQGRAGAGQGAQAARQAPGHLDQGRRAGGGAGGPAPPSGRATDRRDPVEWWGCPDRKRPVQDHQGVNGLDSGR